MPFLSRPVRGAVEFQRLTGWRPGEACALPWCDIDTVGEVRTHKPPRHKNSYRGKPRTIPIGPKAQALLEEFLTGDPGDYLFSPAAAVAEFRSARAAARKMPRRKTGGAKAKAAPRVFPAMYDTDSYGHAIDRACDRAFPGPVPLGQRDDETAAAWAARLTPLQRDELTAWRQAHRWSPNQLRHAYATVVGAARGLEAAQVPLGHAKSDVAERYAAKNDALAASVAAQIG